MDIRVGGLHIIGSKTPNKYLLKYLLYFGDLYITCSHNIYRACTFPILRDDIFVLTQVQTPELLFCSVHLRLL